MTSLMFWTRRERRFLLRCCILPLIAVFLLLTIVLQLSMDSLRADHEEQRDILLPTQKTPSEELILIVLLLSSPKNIDRRDAIRKTWLSDIPAQVKSFFALATKDLDENALFNLVKENKKHRDLLLLPNIVDSYQRLTEKLTESLKWLYNSTEFTYDFLFKGDDDTFVRLDLLVEELKIYYPKRIYWGFFDGRARVKKSGQWAEPNWVLCDRYLPHARGGGYILSSDLVQYIVQNAGILQHFKSEDISVGAWLGPLDIQRIHDPRFDTEYVSRGCNNKYLVTHKQDMDMMKTKHSNLREQKQLCEKEFQSRASYVYNWKVLPSLCCIRNDTSVP